MSAISTASLQTAMIRTMTDSEAQLYVIRYAGGSNAVADEQYALDAARLFRRHNHPLYTGDRAIIGIIPIEDSTAAERAGAALPTSAVLHCVTFAGRMIPHEWEGERCKQCSRTLADWLFDDVSKWLQRTRAMALIEIARRDADPIEGPERIST
jgi:hypothetical protein